MRFSWSDPWFQLCVIALAAAAGWLAFAHGSELVRRARFGSVPTQGVAGVINQAEAAAGEAKAHAAQALRNQALAQDAAKAARDAAEKARQHVPGYASQAPMKQNGATVFAYEGQVAKSGVPEGLEVVNFGGGTVYEGGWKDDLPDGYGVVSFSGGRIHAGKWDKGVNVGQAVTITGDVTWQGDVPGGARNDPALWGVLLCAPDDICVSRSGPFEVAANGVFNLNGPAVVVMRDGRQIKAIWRHGVQQGYGAVLDAKGGLLEQGDYHNGQL